VRERIKVGTAGKVLTAFDIARMMALGADWCNSARGYMFAIGCIQSQACHTDHCPTGVATQDKARQRALVVTDKAERVFHFHSATVTALNEVVAAAVARSSRGKLKPRHFSRRVAANRVETYDTLFRFLKPGELLGGTDDPRFADAWPIARADSWSPVS